MWKIWKLWGKYQIGKTGGNNSEIESFPWKAWGLTGMASIRPVFPCYPGLSKSAFPTILGFLRLKHFHYCGCKCFLLMDSIYFLPSKILHQSLKTTHLLCYILLTFPYLLCLHRLGKVAPNGFTWANQQAPVFVMLIRLTCIDWIFRLEEVMNFMALFKFVLAVFTTSSSPLACPSITTSLPIRCNETIIDCWSMSFLSVALAGRSR